MDSTDHGAGRPQSARAPQDAMGFVLRLPTGVAVAAFRRRGPGMAPAVYLAAVGADTSIGGPPWVAALVGVGNTAGPASVDEATAAAAKLLLAIRQPMDAGAQTLHFTAGPRSARRS